MPVGDHGVGALDALHEVPRTIGERREQAEGAVHVEPCAAPVREVRHRADRVEVPGVHLAGAADHDRGRAAQAGEGGVERLDVEVTDAVPRELVHL